MDSDAIILEPITEPAPPRYAPQRLRLHHLFALTAVMSFLLAVSGPQWNAQYPGFDPPAVVRTGTVLVGIVMTVITSVAVTATLFGIHWRRQGLVYFDQPGHWLMAEMAIGTMLGLIPQFIVYAIGGGYGSQPDFSGADMTPFVVMGVMAILGLAIMGLIVALNVYIAHKKCNEDRWRVVFYFKAAAAVIPLVAHLLVLGFIVRAVLVDRREGQSRDVLHRFGVVVQFAMIGVTFLMMVFVFAAIILQMMKQF